MEDSKIASAYGQVLFTPSFSNVSYFLIFFSVLLDALLESVVEGDRVKVPKLRRRLYESDWKDDL